MTTVDDDMERAFCQVEGMPERQPSRVDVTRLLYEKDHLLGINLTDCC